MILSLQLLRFIAAFLVLISHIPIGESNLLGEFPGVIGVDIFFVLSGFVMYRSLRSTKSPFEFFYERCLRIYPLYIVITLCLVGYKLFMGQIIDISHLATSILLIPNYLNGEYIDPIMVLGWTLQYEMFFYCFIAFAKFTNWAELKIILGFTAFVIGCSVITNDSLQILNSLMFEFLYGMLLCLAYDSKKEIFSYGSGIIAVIFLIVATPQILGTTDDYISYFAIRVRVIFDSGEYLRSLTWGVYAAMIVFAFLALGQRIPKILESLIARLGEISYAVYLVQYVVIPFVLIASPSPLVSTLTIIFITFLGAYLLTYHFDQPLRRFLKSIRGDNGSSPPA